MWLGIHWQLEVMHFAYTGMTCEAFQPSLEPTIHVTHFVHAELKALSACRSVYTFENVHTLLKTCIHFLDKSVYTFGKCIHLWVEVYTLFQKGIHFSKKCMHFFLKCVHFFEKCMHFSCKCMHFCLKCMHFS